MSRAGGATTPLGDAAARWASPHWREVRGLPVRHREAGEGPCIVLVHGLGVSADYWVRNGPQIAAAGYRALAPDLPGFGHTEGAEDGLTVPAQAEALAAWADALALGPAVYVGHSLSCQTVLQLAADAPERVRGLVLAGPTGAPGRKLARQAWGLFLDAFREPLRLFPTIVDAYLRAGLRRFSRTWAAGARHDPLPLLPRVRAPGLIVAGSDDPVVEGEFLQALAAGLPDGRLAIVDGGSHAVIFDRAEAFNAAVLDFLRELDGREIAGVE